MMHYRSLIGMGLIAFVMVALTACGKVVQEVSKEDPPKSFNLGFEVGPVETAVSSLRGLNREEWSVDQDEVFVQISGVGKGGYDELSWGRAVLESKVATASAIERKSSGVPTKTVYESVAYRKSGLKLTGASDHTWTKISFDKNTPQWKITSNKVKRGYPYYRVAFYSGKNEFLLKYLDEKTVSSNKKVAVGRLDTYDLFIGILSAMIFSERSDYLERADTVVLLTQLFPRPFYNDLSYHPPKNTVKTFVKDRPSFTVGGPFERELMKWFFLFDEDVQAAKDYVASYQAPWFTKKLRKSFEGVVSAFEASQKLSSD